MPNTKALRWLRGTMFSMILGGSILGGGHTQPPPPYTPPKPPPLTPFQLNNFSITSLDQAFRYLATPDILMRRSAVEYLGRATATDGAGHSAFDLQTRATFARQARFIPGLIRAVRDLPPADSAQAARLLGAMGIKARSAFPAICDVLGQLRPKDELIDNGSYISSLTQICGGGDRLAPIMIAFLKDKDPEARRAVAAAVQQCLEPLFLNPLSVILDEPPPWRSAAHADQWRRNFQNLVIPALAQSLRDPSPAVRIAAANSLAKLGSDSAQASWNKTVAPLVNMLASSDPRARLAAAKALAAQPGDISDAAPALRACLHRASDERAYALVAFSNSVRISPAPTINAFTADISSPDIRIRGAAAADLYSTANILWSGGFYPDPLPLPESSCAIPIQRMNSFGVTYPRSADTIKAHSLLLRALVKACADPDMSISGNAGGALEKIAKYQNATITRSPMGREASHADSELMQAFAQANAALKVNRPGVLNPLVWPPAPSVGF